MNVKAVFNLNVELTSFFKTAAITEAFCSTYWIVYGIIFTRSTKVTENSRPNPCRYLNRKDKEESLAKKAEQEAMKAELEAMERQYLGIQKTLRRYGKRGSTR